MIGAAATAEKKLHDAASKGDLTTFREVVEEDAYLLEEVTFARSRNLLHTATMWGQAGIVDEMLKLNPQLAHSLDSQKSSPLHIAVAKGNVEITKKLLSVAPEMCWWRDCQKMNPIHIAAINGHVEVLEKLLEIDYLPAMERVYRGQTVLHLCVKHRQLQALKVLMEKLDELVNAKDEDGKTILDWAASTKQLEMIQYLEDHKKIEAETTNSVGNAALQIMIDNPNSEIRRNLSSSSNGSTLKVLPKVSDMTMVVLVLIATMAFQAMVSPPGGVWQDDSSTHKAGKAVMASTYPKLFSSFVGGNTAAFLCSVCTIVLLTTTLPFNSVIFLRITIYGMWFSLSLIVLSYVAAMIAITPNSKTRSYNVWKIVILSFGGLVAISAESTGRFLAFLCVVIVKIRMNCSIN